MRRLTRTWTSACVCSGIIVTLVCGAAPLRAQYTNPLVGTDPAGGNDLNDIWNNRDASSSSLYTLINRLQLLNGRSMSDFNADQDENFNSALKDFRQKQQEQLQSVPPSGPNSSNGSAVPTP